MDKLDLAIIIFAIAFCLILLTGAVFQQVQETASWGLSYESEGLPPSGPLSAEKLQQLGGVYVGKPDEKVLYLTFDAGYENGFTGQILEALKKHRAPAAFFLVGNYLEKNPDLVRKMVEQGHTVGNHTLHHRDLSGADEKTFRQELEGLEEQYQAITGRPMEKFFRPPMGLYSEANLKLAREMGYRTIFWSLAYADWDNDNQPDPEAAMDKLCRRVHPGAVVLLHATSRTNGEILDGLLSRWEQMGYRFAPISELIPGRPL